MFNKWMFERVLFGKVDSRTEEIVLFREKLISDGVNVNNWLIVIKDIYTYIKG